MTTQTVVLVLSPRCAEALERTLTGHQAAAHTADDLPLVAKIVDELRAQRSDLAPLTAKEIGERMAHAGAQAVAL